MKEEFQIRGLRGEEKGKSINWMGFDCRHCFRKRHML